MFNVGDYVVYGSNGVCKISDIGKISISSDDRDYYTMIPVYSNSSTVYTPVDNDKVVLRRIMSKDQAEELVENINTIDTMSVPDEKRREETYKQAIKTCDYVEWAKLIRTSYLRIQDRRTNGKKVINCDEKYMKVAEDFLLGELAIALDMEKEQVRQYIVSKCSENK